ncbi:MAG: hypothetical protein AAFZ07_28515 [Actinomycetota bacterium]
MTASTPLRPGLGTAFTAVYSVLLRSQVKTGRLLGLGALAVVALLLGAVAGTGDDPLRDGTSVIGSFGLAVVVPVGALLIAASTLGDLAEDRTLLYFTMRPMPRWVIATAAWLAALTLTVPAVAVPLIFSSLLTGEGAVVTGAAIASLVGVAAYCGLFLWLGLVVSRALIWGLVYILIWEGFVASAGAGLARLAIRSYTRSLLSWQTEIDLNLADRSPFWSVVVPLAVGAVAVALTARSLSRRDID